MAWYMVWPGDICHGMWKRVVLHALRHCHGLYSRSHVGVADVIYGMIYGMACRAWHCIWYGLAGIAW